MWFREGRVAVGTHFNEEQQRQFSVCSGNFPHLQERGSHCFLIFQCAVVVFLTSGREGVTVFFYFFSAAEVSKKSHFFILWGQLPESLFFLGAVLVLEEVIY